MASNNGFLAVLDALGAANGAGAGFFDDLVFGGWFFFWRVCGAVIEANRQHAIDQSMKDND